MFEQSVDIIKTKKRPWSFAVATSVELALLAAMLLAPLVYIAPVRLPPPPNAMTAYWPHAELPKVESSQTRPPRQNFFIRPRLSQVIFQAPVRIPTTVAQINDLSSPAMDIDAGATSGQGDPGGVPGGVIGSVPDTPPPPAESRKENPSRVGPVRVGGGVQEAKLITRVQPAYPQIAKAARQSGTVEVVAVVGKDGRIRDIQSVQGPALLQRAALDAIRQWVYRPTLLNGLPVEVIAPISVHFMLN